MGIVFDVLTFGDYPELVKKNVGERLGVFTEEEKALLKGAYDFIGISSYTSDFVTRGENKPENIMNDS